MSAVKYYKLPYLGRISTDDRRKISRFSCINLNIKVALTPFKVADVFNVKDPIPKSLKSFLVCKFVQAVMPVT